MLERSLMTSLVRKSQQRSPRRHLLRLRTNSRVLLFKKSQTKRKRSLRTRVSRSPRTMMSPPSLMTLPSLR
jgi:hypothetical protein